VNKARSLVAICGTAGTVLSMFAWVPAQGIAQDALQGPDTSRPSGSDAYTGLPSNTDPYTGLPRDTDAYTGRPTGSDAYTGLPSNTDPYTGLPRDTDAYTGRPTGSDPYRTTPKQDSKPSLQYHDSHYSAPDTDDPH
jgi:hypothetical protein